MTFQKLSKVLFLVMIWLIHPLFASDDLESREDKGSASQSHMNKEKEVLVTLFRDIKIARLTSLGDELIKMEEVCKAFETMVSASPLDEQRTFTFLGMIFGEYAGNYNAFKTGVLPFLPEPWSMGDYLVRIQDPDFAFCLSTEANGKLSNVWRYNDRHLGLWTLKKRRLHFAPFWTDKARNIGVLDLSDNYIEFLPDMIHWAHLTELDLSCNRLKSLKYLEKLVSLWKLNVEGNQISDLSPVSKMSVLSSLSISDNPIESLTPLVSLSSLETLHLNRLRRGKEHLPLDWETLKKLEKLFVLGLDNNNIVEFGPIVDLLCKLPVLIELSLEQNRIEVLLPVQHNRLRTLKLKGNPIKSILPLKGLAKLADLMVDQDSLKGRPRSLEELKNWGRCPLDHPKPQSLFPSAEFTQGAASGKDATKKKKKKRIKTSNNSGIAATSAGGEKEPLLSRASGSSVVPPAKWYQAINFPR